MSEDNYKMIFAKNLKLYMDRAGKTQVDLINDLGFNRSSVSTWVNGKRLPRMDKVDILAKYFGILRSDLIEEKNMTNMDWSASPELTEKDQKDIAKDLQAYREHLSSAEGLMFDGEPASEEAIQSILDSLELGLEIAKKRNKEKYTPKKYRK